MGTLSSKSFQSKWKLGVRLSYESILLLKNPCIVNANINIKPGMYSENFNWPTDHHLDSEGFELQHKNKLKEYSKIFPRTTSLQYLILLCKRPLILISKSQWPKFDILYLSIFVSKVSKHCQLLYRTTSSHMYLYSKK